MITVGSKIWAEIEIEVDSIQKNLLIESEIDVTGWLRVNGKKRCIVTLPLDICTEVLGTIQA